MKLLTKLWITYLNVVFWSIVSLLSYALIALLVISEVSIYFKSKVKFLYSVDTDFDRFVIASDDDHLKIYNLNILQQITTECRHYCCHELRKYSIVDHWPQLLISGSIAGIGADILDSTNTNNAYTYGRLVEEPTYFDLTEAQRSQWNVIRDINNYLRDEHHSLQEVLWKKDILSQRKYGRDLPPREKPPIGDPDACRLHGTLVVNKVSGNFHITVGKHLPMPLGHAHISLFTSERG